MSSSASLRGFSQLVRERSANASIVCRNVQQTACFSTSAARYANPVKKKGGMAPAPKRGTKTLNVKKGRKEGGGDSGKPPAVGERKALRKRIVLSNNNALEVTSLKDVDKTTVLAQSNEGKVVGIPEETVDALRAVEAFKVSQGWSLFRRPAVLMRKETTELANLFKEVERANTNGEKAQTLRRILTGVRMSGKSTLLLQGLMMAHLREWVVINLPDAKDLVNAHTEYAPVPESQPTQYFQETYTAALLTQIQKANQIHMKLPVTQSHPDISLPAKATLKNLLDVGIANPEESWPVFEAFWKELSQPGRPPIFFGLDGLSHIMRDSEYLSAEVKPIHAFDLTLIRQFVDHLSGEKKLPNGGIILGATSKSNAPRSEAMDFSIQCAEARQFAPETMPRWNPYKNIDMRVMEALKDVQVLKVGGLSKEEARSIIEYYAESGMLRARVDDGFVSERWSLAGMGNVGELERCSVRMRV